MDVSCRSMQGEAATYESNVSEDTFPESTGITVSIPVYATIVVGGGISDGMVHCLGAGDLHYALRKVF